MVGRLLCRCLMLFGAIVVVGGLSVTAGAQTPPLAVVQTSSGDLYLVQGGDAWLLVPNQISDSDFASLNISGEADGTIPSQVLSSSTPEAPSTPQPSTPPRVPAPCMTGFHC